MANKKITELPLATTPLAGTEEQEIIQGGVNKRVAVSEVGGGGTSIPYGATTGTNTYAITATPAVTAYADGDLFLIKVVLGSTGASTLNFNSVGAKKVYDHPDRQITNGDFEDNRFYIVSYDAALDSAVGGFIVVGDLNHERVSYRGGYTVSSNLFPSTGGSGPGGAIKTGDFWVAGGTGTLGTQVVNDRDWIVAIGEGPGQTSGNWSILAGLLSTDTKLALKAPLASPALTGTPTAPTAAAGTNTTQLATTQFVQTAVSQAKSFVVAVTDEVTNIGVGTGKVSFRMPYAMTLTAVRASLVVAQASGTIFTVDINEAGVSILSTKLTIDNTETTSVSAATPAVISDTALADDAVITVDVDQIGDGTAIGLKITLIGT